jgi:hypothetical protein
MFPHEKPEIEIKMVKFSGSDSFIGFIDLKKVGVEPKNHVNRLRYNLLRLSTRHSIPLGSTFFIPS